MGDREIGPVSSMIYRQQQAPKKHQKPSPRRKNDRKKEQPENKYKRSDSEHDNNEQSTNIDDYA